MRTDIDHYINHVFRCLKQKKLSANTREQQQSFTSTAPFELISIDFVHLERSSGGTSRLPVDLMFHLPEKQEVTGYPVYVRKWKTAMQEAYKRASASRGEGDEAKQQRIRSTGDRVLMRNLTPREGPGKL
ncbi:Hypothetical predicted protein [Paramuricea clavata]|uniref:Uncharacterized protein n=1 Tax=Paramuricea clavata TaxID=317549 RepID=A0A7D9JDB6_PARCT|nr:Hypothetical predicted protein [Paramuricea clavata]